MTGILRHRSLLLAAATLFCSSLALPEIESSVCADDAAIVAPFVTEQTFGIVKVDTGNLELPQLPDVFASLLPGGTEAMGRHLATARQIIAATAKATDGQPVYGVIGTPNSPTDWPAMLLLKKTPQVDTEALVQVFGASASLELVERDGLVVAIPKMGKEPLGQLAALGPSRRDGLSEAFATVQSYPVQFLLLPPDFVRRTIAELLPTLPENLGGGPSRVLLDGCLWTALGVDPAELKGELVIQSASEQAAQDLAATLPGIAEAAYNANPRVQKQVPRESFQSLLSLLHLEVQADCVIIGLAGKEAAGSMQLAATILGVLKGRVDERENMNKFKRIMIAMHNYHDRYGMFPPRNEVRNEEGKTGLSWRVHLLPFVEQKKLYEKFHLDEPWDSPHNKALIAEMPKVYQGGEFGLAPGYTTFQVPVGEGTAFGGPKACRMNLITDGTSNTIALVQVKPERAVPWTAPQDYTFDPKDPAEGLAVDGEGLFLSAMFDGSVRRTVATIKPEMLLRMFQKSDGKTVEW